jgi:predicted RNA binding protein YcfA (HicA-like mRNA interferase family)
MPRKYPPLNPDEVVCILRARGFDYDHSRGSHEYYKGMTRGVHRMVTVDLHYREFVSSQVLWDFAGSRCWGLRLATHANSQRPSSQKVGGGDKSRAGRVGA